MTGKSAAASVVACHAQTLAALPFSGTETFADAARGFLGTRPDALITSAQGRVVWSLEPYGFLADEQAPATVNPSLWRQSRLNMNHGLFEVVPGIYQVRGFDIANMTLIEGDTGVIVVDTLTSIEGARAAMELYFEHRGRRPVAAVIFTHTHIDHWGGARGVLDDAGRDVPIIAPDLFMDHAVSENVIAGPAMMRRAHARCWRIRLSSLATSPKVRRGGTPICSARRNFARACRSCPAGRFRAKPWRRCEPNNSGTCLVSG